MEDYALISILTTVGAIVMSLIISAVVRAPGASMASQFKSLGNLQGKAYEEIKSVVGEANSISVAAGGNTVRQWMATGYHIALLFDSNDICLGITHESQV